MMHFGKWLSLPTLCTALLSITQSMAQNVEAVAKSEMSLEHVRACQGVAASWSDGIEFKYLIKEAAGQEVEVTGTYPEQVEYVKGELIGPTSIKRGAHRLYAIRLHNGGTCSSDSILLAEKIRAGVSSKPRYRALVSDASEPESTELPHQEIRWSYWGNGDRLIKLSGKTYKLRGNFVDLRKGQQPSAYRKVAMLFALSKTQWQPICSFSTTKRAYKVDARSTEPFCRRLAAGNFSSADAGSEFLKEEGVDRYFVSGENPSQSGLWVFSAGYDSGAGCGNQYVWLYSENETLGKTKNEMLKSGLPESLDLNRIKRSDPSYKRYADDLVDFYPRLRSATTPSGGPNFASANVSFIQSENSTSILRPRVNKDGNQRFDFEVLQNSAEGIKSICEVQYLPQVGVNYWYRVKK